MSEFQKGAGKIRSHCISQTEHWQYQKRNKRYKNYYQYITLKKVKCLKSLMLKKRLQTNWTDLELELRCIKWQLRTMDIDQAEAILSVLRLDLGYLDMGSKELKRDLLLFAKNVILVCSMELASDENDQSSKRSN